MNPPSPEEHNPAVFTLATGMNVAVTGGDGQFFEGVVTETGFSPPIGEYVEVDVNGELKTFRLTDPWNFATF